MGLMTGVAEETRRAQYTASKGSGAWMGTLWLCSGMLGVLRPRASSAYLRIALR